MTRRQIEARIRRMLDEYAYSDTWPAGYQEEYERLCELLHGKAKPERKG
jgi:hypothetical protein